jgi:hydrogenase maturation protease
VRVVALAVGDETAGDEAAGLRVAALIAPNLPDAVELYAPGAVDASLVVELEGTSHLLVLDAVDFGRTPGTLVRFDTESMRPCALSASVHAYGVADLLVRLGQYAEAPEEIVVLAVQPAVSDHRTSLSPPVEAALPAFVLSAESVLRDWLGLGPLDPLGQGPAAHPIHC